MEEGNISNAQRADQREGQYLQGKNNSMILRAHTRTHIKMQSPDPTGRYEHG